MILKAGQDSVGFDILLYRTEAMQTEEVRLQVRIDGSGDLQPGVDAWSALTIAWNDKITKPGNWEDLTEFSVTIARPNTGLLFRLWESVSLPMEKQRG